MNSLIAFPAKTWKKSNTGNGLRKGTRYMNVLAANGDRDISNLKVEYEKVRYGKNDG